MQKLTLRGEYDSQHYVTIFFSVQVWFRPCNAQSQGRRLVRMVGLDFVFQDVRIWCYFQE
jgi:hypothetical protein